MTTKEIAPHGSPSRYKGRGDRPPCRCPLCVAAESRRAKRQRYRSAIGQLALVDAEPVALHIELLRAGGASVTAIAAVAGCSRDTLHYAFRAGKMTREIADRVLAVTAGQAIYALRPVPALGSARRLQALYAAKHSLGAIAAQTGLSRQFLAGVVSEKKPTIAAETADRIDACWQALKNSEGDCHRNRYRAVREGWPGPEMWVDDDIDAPEEAGPEPMSKEASLVLARQLTLEGQSAEDIAKAIGRTSRTVWRWQAKHGWKEAS